MLASCASLPWDIETLARAGGAQRLILAGPPFQLLGYFRPGADVRRPLHVYIDHDGLPWIDGTRVAADPSPRDPIALRLMLQDPAPSLYLGRPCHFGVDGSPPCQPLLWTHARYGEAVVDSLAQALDRFRAGHRFEHIALIGYSGGGTLAVLLAERVPGVDAVVTVAGNLDVAGWARLHDYSPLAGSLDPATRPALPASIRQVHLVGSADTNVAPALVLGYVANHPPSRARVLAGYDHRCCWAQAWDRILPELLSP